jgi:hypothetical protein
MMSINSIEFAALGQSISEIEAYAHQAAEAFFAVDSQQLVYVYGKAYQHHTREDDSIVWQVNVRVELK